jgi:S-layer homology domain
MAVAGVAVAATVGGLVFAASAQAATAPSLTWTAPTQVLNDGAAPGAATLAVNNSAAGSAAIAGTAEIDVTGPSSLVCADLAVTGATPGDLAFGALSGANGTCSATTAFAQSTTSVTYNERVTLHQPGETGSFTSSVKITVAGPPPATLATSNSQTTAMVNGTAPSFVNTAVPPAIVYHDYNFQFATSSANPAVSDPSEVSAFGTHKNSDGTYSCTIRGGTSGKLGTDATAHVIVDLGNGFFFDATLGAIRSPSTQLQTIPDPQWTWTIIENNGEGGASTSAAGATDCSVNYGALPTPAVAVHDVMSPQFRLPVLFSDVALSNQFATAIYTLNQVDVLGGFADGTFRPRLNVSRQAFAHFLYGVIQDQKGGLDTNPCGASGSPSTFSDVPNSSQFCTEIRDLNRIGVIGGYSDGTFHPAAPITRQAIAAMIYRAFNYINGLPSGDAACTTPIPFNDVSASNPFCGDIEWMNSHHYANGYSDGGYHPTANTSRQATAAFLFRIWYSAASPV